MPFHSPDKWSDSASYERMTLIVRNEHKDDLGFRGYKYTGCASNNFLFLPLDFVSQSTTHGLHSHHYHHHHHQNHTIFTIIAGELVDQEH